MKKIDSLPEGFVDLGEKIAYGSLEIKEPSKEEYHYPILYFDNAESLGAMPKEGLAVIYYKKTMERKETTTRNGKTEKKHIVELCICGIKPKQAIAAEPEESEEESDEDAIEKGLEEAEEETKNKNPKIEIEIET